MRERDSSMTAKAIATHRKAELWLPKKDRICDDPYAPAFVGPDDSLLSKIWIPKKFELWLWSHQKKLPGLHNALVARMRHGDECVRQYVQEGGEQVVILGAGYDTRAYRLRGISSGLTFFEVDHPATQAVKKETIKKIFGALPGYVVYVPLDFNIQSLEELLKSGYDPSRKTLYLWEGVTYYISRQAVEQTLRFISNHAGKGSTVFFDFFPPAVVAGTSPLKEARKLRRNVASFGEPLLFGMEPDEMHGFLSQCGFQTIQILDADEIHHRYFIGRNAKRYVSPMFTFAQAAT